MLHRIHQRGLRRRACSLLQSLSRPLSSAGESRDARWPLLREKLRLCDAPCICDSDKTLQTLSRLQPRHSGGRGIQMIGLARTVETVEGPGGIPDFRNVVEALMESSPGEVLVIDTKGSPISVAGELFTAEARRLGLAGILIDGACRDTPTIFKLDFPVFSLSVNPMAGCCATLDKSRLGGTVTVGGVEIRQGDVIFGDHDGVINLGSDIDKIEALVKRATNVRRNEQKVLKEIIERGRCLMEFMPMFRDTHPSAKKVEEEVDDKAQHR